MTQQCICPAHRLVNRFPFWRVAAIRTSSAGLQPHRSRLSGPVDGSKTEDHPLRRRAARVVAWLEHLAGQALDDEDDAVRRAGGSAGRFAPDEGLWKETRLRIAAGVPQKPGEQRRAPERLTAARLLVGVSLSICMRELRCSFACMRRPTRPFGCTRMQTQHDAVWLPSSARLRAHELTILQSYIPQLAHPVIVLPEAKQNGLIGRPRNVHETLGAQERRRWSRSWTPTRQTGSGARWRRTT